MPDIPLSAKGLRKGRSYQCITVKVLARVMGFSPETVRHYVGAGLLRSIEYRGETWVVQPGQRWSVQQILDEGHRRAEGKPIKLLRSVPYLDARAVAEILNVCPRRVQVLAAQGILPSIQINPHGGPYRFALCDVTRFIHRRLNGMTPKKREQARAQLEVIRRLARRRLR